MQNPPTWYLPVAIVALIWNLLGCMAYLADVMMSPEDIAQMTAAQQELYASRTAWMVSATAIAVWGGAAGSLGLILRKRWARPLLIASLLGVIVQDFGLFVVADGAAVAGPAGLALQGLVLVVCVALVMLSGKAVSRGWIPGGSVQSA